MAPVTTELGFTNAFPGLLSAYSQWDQFEQVPELLWPDAIRTYTRMWREESRLASVYYAIALPIMQTQWRIEPNGAPDNVVQHVSDDLGLPIVGEDVNKPRPRTKGRFSWLEHLQWAMRHLHFGHAVFEQVYRPDEKNPDRLRLRKLAPRPQSTIAFWNVDADGGLIGIQQWPPGTGFGGAAGAPNYLGAWAQEIPVNRLVVYTRDRDPGVWTGNSIFRPAYKNWLLKDELIRIEATAARRNGMGVPVVTAPESVSMAAPGSDALAPYLKIAQQYRGGNNAGVALPAGSTFELAGVKGQLPSGFIRQAIEYHDKQMALAALAHFLNLDRGGSFALASVQADTFSQGVQQTAETVRDTAQTHIVEDIVDTNFGEDSPSPRIVFDAIGSQQDASAAALQMLVSAGIIKPDPQLEAFERQSMGLPGADPDAQDDEPLPVPDNRPPETVPIATTHTPDGMAFTSRARVTASRGRRPRVTISSDGDLTLW